MTKHLTIRFSLLIIAETILYLICKSLNLGEMHSPKTTNLFIIAVFVTCSFVLCSMFAFYLLLEAMWLLKKDERISKWNIIIGTIIYSIVLFEQRGFVSSLDGLQINIFSIL